MNGDRIDGLGACLVIRHAPGKPAGITRTGSEVPTAPRYTIVKRALASEGP